MSGPGRNYTEKEIQTDGKRIMKKSNKYSYIQGKQITDVDTGTRF